MAENLDPNSIEELNRRFNELNETSNNLGSSFTVTRGFSDKLGESFDKLSKQVNKLVNNNKDQKDKETKTQETAIEATEKRIKAEQDNTKVIVKNSKEEGEAAKRILQSNSSVEGALDTLQSKLTDMAGGGIGATMALHGLRLAIDGVITVMKTSYDAQVTFTKSILAGERGLQVVARQSEQVGKSFNNVIDQIGNFLIGLGGVTAILGGPVGMAFGAASAAAGIAAKTYAKASNTALEFATQIAGLKDKLFQGFNELGKASMIGVGGMKELQNQLHTMQMSMAEVSEFTGLVKSAGKELRLLGPSTSESLKEFVGTAGGLIKSDLGRTLEIMGITAADQREHTLQFLTQQSRLGLTNNKTQAELSKAAGKYILEMDKLAELTGATRKEQEEARNQILAIEELRAAMLDANTQEEKERLGNVLKNAEALYAAGAKGLAAGIAKAGAAGGAITSVEAAKARMAAPEAFDRMVQGLGKPSENIALAAKESTAFAKQFAGTGKYNAKAFESVLPDMFGATKDFGDKMSKAEDAAQKKNMGLDEFIEQLKKVNNKETIDRVDLQRQLREKAIEDEKSAGTLSHAAGQFGVAVDKFGSIIADYAKMLGVGTTGQAILRDPQKVLEQQKTREAELLKRDKDILAKADLIDKAGIYAAKGIEQTGSLLGKRLSALGLEGIGSRLEAMAGAAKEERISAGSAEIRKREGDPLAGLNFGGRREERTGGGVTDPNLIAMAHKVNETFPGVVITALNDKFHQENRKTSKHTVGKALDFAMNPPPKDAKEAQDIVGQLQSMGASKVLDEYFANKTSKTTGGHFHVEVAHDGGYFKSSTNDFSGEFPVLLKSNEYVLTQEMINNLKDKLSNNVEKTPIETAFPEAVSKETATVSTDTTKMSEMFHMLIDAQNTFNSKLDSMIDVLETGVTIQNKLLSYSRV